MCRLTVLLFSVMAVLPFANQRANAVLVDYTFSGQITNIETPALDAILPFTIGSPFNGRITYDTSLAPADSFPGDPTFGKYSNTTNFVTMEWTVGGNTFTTGTGFNVFVDVGNAGLDSFAIADFGTGTSSNWTFTSELNGRPVISFNLADSTGTTFSSDALPTSLNLASFTLFKSINFENDGASSTITTPLGTFTGSQRWGGTITSLTAVPEASTVVVWSLISVGAIVAAYLRRSS